MEIVKINCLKKIYEMGVISVIALNRVSLEIEKGEFVSIMGPSGSGKSTLMNIVGCLDQPTEGSIEIDGIEISKMSGAELAYIRNKKIGFVFQSFNLLSSVDALSNVMLPLLYSDFPKEKRRGRAIEVLKAVGLEDRLVHKPNELSGGQRQRLAIARALVNNADIILADEPTGNLDSRSGMEITSLLQRLNQDGMTILMVTHDENLAHYTDRIIYIKDGSITKIDKVMDKKFASME